MRIWAPIGASVLLVAMASPGLCEDTPVNLAGYSTVSLAEAGMSRQPDHAASDTVTSPVCARSVRRAGKTTSTTRTAPPAQCAASDTGRQTASRE